MKTSSLLLLFFLPFTVLAFADQAEQEAAFSAMLKNATLDGRNIPLVEGALGEPSGDKYQIVSATKVEGDQWQITYMAKMQGQMVPLPIPVTVKWADDTAVLIVNDLRGYSARVLFHEDSYAGTWSGNGRGGLISGIITRGE